MKPKARRRISVRKRSGRLEIVSPSTVMRPEVGRAMQAIRLNSVVLPDPLGPVIATAPRPSSVRLTSRTAANSFGWPALKTLVTSRSSIT